MLKRMVEAYLGIEWLGGRFSCGALSVCEGLGGLLNWGLPPKTKFPADLSFMLFIVGNATEQLDKQSVRAFMPPNRTTPPPPIQPAPQNYPSMIPLGINCKLAAHYIKWINDQLETFLYIQYG